MTTLPRAASLAVALATASCAAPDTSSQSLDWSETENRTDVVGELAYGHTHRGLLDPDRLSGFTFDAEAGDVISAFATPLPRAGAAVDPLVLLYGPDGGEPLAIAEAPGEEDAHLVDHRIAASGRHRLVVADGAAAGGEFRVRLACTGGACRPELHGEPDPACALSPLGASVLNAALAAEQSRNTVPETLMATYENGARDALVTGPVLFPAIADAIAMAESEVDIAMFVYDYSDAYEEMLDALGRLASRRRAAGSAQPVVVRIVVDAQKILFNTGSKMAKRVFDGIADLRLDPDHVQVQIATYTHFTLGALHSKLVVVDGKTAMLGGANIQSQHDYAAPWMDSFYALEGRAAQTFLADFDHAWNKSVKWHCEAGADGEPRCQSWDEAPAIWHPAEVLEPDFGESSGLCVPAIALNRTAWGGFNNDVDNPMGQGVLAAMDGAEARIRIQTPNLNDDAVKDAIVRAVARGVEVQVVLSLGFNDTAEKLFGGTNEDNAASLTARVQAETPATAHLLGFRWYSADGVAPIDGNVPGASHLKYLSVDGQLAIVGSINMDTQSWNHSREANVAVDRAGVTALWDAQVFEPNWQRGIPALP